MSYTGIEVDWVLLQYGCILIALPLSDIQSRPKFCGVSYRAPALRYPIQTYVLFPIASTPPISHHVCTG
jgi:hypothetical protein